MALVLKQPIEISTDEDLARVSSENPGHRFEREEDGAIVVSPTFTKGGSKSAEACGQLRDYAKVAGGKAYDSSTGFAIGPGRRLVSPDASWVSSERMRTLSESELAGFWPLSPDVAIEVRSATDAFRDTIAKIESYVERGTAYAVAIDPVGRNVVERGTPPPGLTLDFNAIIEA